MIARHSYEQSGDGEGVEVIENKECEDEEHGKGQYTEKHIHLSRYVRCGVLACEKNASEMCREFFHIFFISLFAVVSHIGCRQFVHGYSTLSKNLGTIIRLQSQVSHFIHFAMDDGIDIMDLRLI